MNNPYTHSTGPAPATPEMQQLSDYELAVGANRDYYLPKFEEFDKGGSKLGWHWPAFFATTPWFLYRKMWGWGMGNLAYISVLVTFIAPIAVGIAAAAAGKGSEVSAIAAVGIVIGVLLLVPAIVLPMFANALYWRHVKKMLDRLPSSIAQQPEKRATRIKRNGGTSVGTMIAVLVGGAFLFIVIVGMLAAISIPAYQDYTIRSQVFEGLNSAAPAKAAVAEYYAQRKEWPADNAAAGFDGSSGKYFESITIENGSIRIVYGGQANQKLVGKTLILSPGVTDNDVVWMCGNKEPPSNVERAPGPYGTELPNKYLPALCRPTS